MRIPSSDGYVQAFARGLSVIRSFGPNSAAQTLSQVAEATGLDRAGARRFLLTLEKLGYVRREGRSFHLTPHILEIGYSYLSTLPLRSIAEPVVRELVEDVSESSSVSVLDGSDIVYIVRVPVKKIMTITLSIGSHIPAYCSAMGRILLGGLSQSDLALALKNSVMTRYTRYTVTSRQEITKIVAADQSKGWSMCNQELEEGICSIAVPLVDREGAIIAAMNITANLSRTVPSEMVRKFLPRLKKAAERINASLRLKV
ncbi:MAG TPA: IclR family transcriptional regulator C-terminal domain-containing protein [Bryobacteraceae bacterium]|nr:IclR family transcriptional regulator C-terminal domain-containing protein [Bryobacteraceae bacterium]